MEWIHPLCGWFCQRLFLRRPQLNVSDYCLKQTCAINQNYDSARPAPETCERVQVQKRSLKLHHCLSAMSSPSPEGSCRRGRPVPWTLIARNLLQRSPILDRRKTGSTGGLLMMMQLKKMWFQRKMRFEREKISWVNISRTFVDFSSKSADSIEDSWTPSRITSCRNMCKNCI